MKGSHPTIFITPFPALFMSNRSPVHPPSPFSWQIFIEPPTTNNPPKAQALLHISFVCFRIVVMLLPIWKYWWLPSPPKTLTIHWITFTRKCSLNKAKLLCRTCLLSVVRHSIPSKIQQPMSEWKMRAYRGSLWQPLLMLLKEQHSVSKWSLNSCMILSSIIHWRFHSSACWLLIIPVCYQHVYHNRTHIQPTCPFPCTFWAGTPDTSCAYTCPSHSSHRSCICTQRSLLCFVWRNLNTGEHVQKHDSNSSIG